MSSEAEIFIPEQPLDVPVLFLVFNRLDTTKEVFEAIRKAKPPKIYIASDGARIEREGEDKKVLAVRDYVLNNIDWPCEVKTLFRDKNLGCKYAVSSAISWFFENEEMGIILEDDCLPSMSFFWFCEKLLLKYKNEHKVWMISGDNFQDGQLRGPASYYFSIFSHIWGWASWADRWKKYDVELNDVSSAGFIDNFFNNKKSAAYWKKIFFKMKNNEINTWDYQWTFAIWVNNGVSIIPNSNMVSNIGFGEAATHTEDPESVLANRKRFELKKIIYSANIVADNDADEYVIKKMFTNQNLFIRIFKRTRRLLKCCAKSV